MRMMKLLKIFSVFIMLVISGSSYAQQDALFSQYMFNPYAINPAYAGSRSTISGVVLHRSQWVGMAGSPKTTTLSLHSPFKGRNFALGMTLMNDNIGPTTNTGFLASYGYHIKVLKGKLSFGLRGGMFSTRLNKGMLNYDDASDVHNTGGLVKSTSPNFDFGTYYYTQHFYLGLSVNHLAGISKSNSSMDGNSEFILDRHYSLATGYAFAANPNIVVKPSLLVKYVNGAPINIDINTSVLFSKVFWLGASYRSSGSIILITEYNISDFLRIGYSYDFILGNLKKYNSGSHELFIGVDFALGKQKTISPRYL